MDDKYIKMLKAMLSGSITSIQVFILTLIFAIPLALPVAMGRMSKNKLLSGYKCFSFDYKRNSFDAPASCSLFWSWTFYKMACT